MTRYCASLILERGEVSLPEGLQHGMSPQWCFFLNTACQSCVSVTLFSVTSVFSVTQRLQCHWQGQTSQESGVMDVSVCRRGWRGHRSSER